MLPTTTPNNTPTTPDPLKQCMDMLDSFIKAGGATADDLNNLKMDLQDAQDSINSEDQSESQNTGNQDISAPPGMAGIIQKMQGA